MRRSAQHAAVVLLVAAASLAALEARDSPLPPKPTRYATDRAGVFAPARLEALNERLAAFERETSNQVLVYVDRQVPPGTTIEEMGSAALRAWGVGQKGRDNGLLFFVFTSDRVMRVEVGYGLEGTVTDAAARRITSDVVKPFFKRDDYAGGVEAGANALMTAARGAGFRGSGPAAAPRPRPRPLVKKTTPPPPRPAPPYAGFWALAGRTLAIGAGLAAGFLFVMRLVSRRAFVEDVVFYGRVFMAAFGVGTAIVAALQGQWLFAGIAFVVGLLFMVDYHPTPGERSTSSSYDSPSSYDSSSSYSSSSDSSSSSSSSDYSGGGGDGGGGGSTDRW